MSDLKILSSSSDDSSSSEQIQDIEPTPEVDMCIESFLRYIESNPSSKWPKSRSELIQLLTNDFCTFNYSIPPSVLFAFLFQENYLIKSSNGLKLDLSQLNKDVSGVERGLKKIIDNNPSQMAIKSIVKSIYWLKKFERGETEEKNLSESKLKAKLIEQSEVKVKVDVDLIIEILISRDFIKFEKTNDDDDEKNDLIIFNTDDLEIKQEHEGRGGWCKYLIAIFVILLYWSGLFQMLFSRN